MGVMRTGALWRNKHSKIDVDPAINYEDTPG